ncbi:Ty3/gypsy retrotransposon protein [Quillaja saponaria]|uniref:Ty3/gypsy retrotransposon protein n=1 Tax=Quillaja saponaria TaxID=32244 RepID=A0AAD7QCT1_QUISA|nr:Ty3/gypsy retrotransposon protein [Quillaja saponaria]
MKLAKVQENLLNSTIYRKNMNYNNKTLTPFTHDAPHPNSLPSPFAKFLPNVPPNPRTQQGSSYKSSLISSMNSNQSTNRRPIGNTSNQSFQSNLATRKPPLIMTKAKMEEKRRNGLCFYCNDRFSQGHKCRNGQSLITITVDKEEDVEKLDEVMDFLDYVLEKWTKKLPFQYMLSQD